MLILQRRQGQSLNFSVKVDGKEVDFSITFCKVSGQSVKVGIDATKEVTVVRSELTKF